MMATNTFMSTLLCVAIVALSGSNNISSYAQAQEIVLPEDFKAGLDSNKYDLVLDVREEDEWNDGNGHIPGSILLPSSTFETSDFLSQDGFSCNKSCATIVVYCVSGKRSGRVIDTLVNEMGFTGTVLNGQGTNQWIEAGYEMTIEDESALPPPMCTNSDICVGTDENEDEASAPDDGKTAVTAMEAGDDSESSAPSFAKLVVVVAALLVSSFLLV